MTKNTQKLLKLVPLGYPLIDIDSGAFDQEFQLDVGAFDFIDGEILKKGHPLH